LAEIQGGRKLSPPFCQENNVSGFKKKECFYACNQYQTIVYCFQTIRKEQTMNPSDLYNTENSNKLTALFEKLVPPSDTCKTYEGELVRAASRIIYRFLNDGDNPCEGYGVETSGPALIFLINEGPDEVKSAANDCVELYSESTLANRLDKLSGAIVSYIDAQENLTENEMINGKPEYDIFADVHGEEAEERWKEEYCMYCGMEESYCMGYCEEDEDC
jgi:hypothetical protein